MCQISEHEFEKPFLPRSLLSSKTYIMQMCMRVCGMRVLEISNGMEILADWKHYFKLPPHKTYPNSEKSKLGSGLCSKN